MATTQRDSDTTLQIVRLFKAGRARVFRAFTDPRQLRQWFCPEGFSFRDIRADPQSGLGHYFEMVHQQSGARYEWTLEYEVVDEPNRIVWISTWGDGFDDKGRKTRVTLEFREVDGATELTLTQEGFTSRLKRDEHGAGWGGGLDKLARLLDRDR